MSQSSGHEGEFGLPPPESELPGESLDEQLAAEFADHLAAAAAEFVRRGTGESDAERLATAQFGDVAKFQRQCWWIHKREDVMYRTATVALLSFLVVGLLAVGLAGWRFERRFSTQLASLTETQQALLAQQRPPEITGTCYVGDKSRPAADVEIEVYRFSEQPPAAGMSTTGVVTRRIRTDEKGRFSTGLLQPADYCLLATPRCPQGVECRERLLDQGELGAMAWTSGMKVMEGAAIFRTLQSAPLFLTVGATTSNVEFDLLAGEQITVACKTPLPETVKIEDTVVKVSVRLQLRTVDDQWRDNPISPSEAPSGEKWPLPIRPQVGHAPIAELPRSWYVPARDYCARLTLMFSPDPAIPPLPNFGGIMGQNGLSMVAPAMPKVYPVRCRGGVTLKVELVGDSLEAQVEKAIESARTQLASNKQVETANKQGLLVHQALQYLYNQVQLAVEVEPASASLGK